jgi:hypothetical protein
VRFIAPGRRGWCGKDRGIEPLLDGMRIFHCATYVWSTFGQFAVFGNDARHVLASRSYVQWSAMTMPDRSGHVVTAAHV